MQQNRTCLYLLIAVMSICATQTMSAQSKRPLEFSWRFLAPNYSTPQITDSKLNDLFDGFKLRGAEFGVHRKFNERLSIGLPLALGAYRFRNSNTSPLRKSELISSLDVLATLYATKSTAWIRPYINVGPGILRNWDSKKTVGQLAAGLGINIPIGEGAAVDFGSQFRLGSNDVNGCIHRFGLNLGLGGEPEMKTPPPPPDRDGDGIIDAGDKCPDVPGLAALMGCPDADSDGVTDLEDKCPSVAGTVALMGCPDTDMDGITDASDKCPTVAGTAALMGCPDTDMDGIADADDKCPTVAGTRALMGCPEPKKEEPKPVTPTAKVDGDTDRDGVLDSKDKCPTVVGTAANNGCPEIKKEDKARIDFAIKNIRFKTSSNVLTTESYTILDEVATVLGKYPDYSVSIAGHTDSDGDAASNLSLSEKRAKSCYDYLVKKGIQAVRMNHAGYGETQPISDNKTTEGKQMNRRVDFNLFIK
jgi:OmpA-OmpF porin, OOP family